MKCPRMDARYQRLKAEGRCVQCAERLITEPRGSRCPECYESVRYKATGAMAAKRARLAAELAKIIETAHELNPLQQAELLGIDVDRVYAHRATARRRGHDLPNLGTPTKYHDAGNWARIEQDAKHRCRRCGLRGDHVCLRGNATDRRAVG